MNFMAFPLIRAPCVRLTWRSRSCAAVLDIVYEILFGAPETPSRAPLSVLLIAACVLLVTIISAAIAVIRRGAAFGKTLKTWLTGAIDALSGIG
jgi:hypothetical protein